MNIIGICGQKNSGKSTVARFCADLVPGTVEIQLAAPMKRFCADVFGWGDDVLNGPSENRERPDIRYRRWESGSLTPEPGHWTLLTPRFALQTLGTDWGRACYEDVWIDYALREAQKLLTVPYFDNSGSCSGRGYVRRPSKASLVVIPDVRFINEARRIRAAGGQVWRVRRYTSSDDYQVLTMGPKSTLDTHASEREQFSPAMDGYISWDIVNDRSLELLREDVRRRLDHN